MDFMINMNVQVIYFSRAGQTKKIAKAIASECGVNPVDVCDAKLHDDVIVFLGSGCYGGKAGKEMKEFIKSSDFSSKSVALFGTSGGGVGKEVEDMKKMLLEKGADVKGEFYCKGKFFVMNWKKPDEVDLNYAKNFAKDMIK